MPVSKLGAVGGLIVVPLLTLRKLIDRVVRRLSVKTPKLEFETYSPDYFVNQQGGSRKSARVILPLAVRATKPATAIDIGCGVGTWVAELLALGVDAKGVDGAYVQTEMLQIPKEQFIPADLRNLPPAAEFGQFDLAICLEIAEHLPESCADALIKFLSELAPAVLFGAAIPGQGGVNHINEQWQSYWVAKFSRHQLYPHDIIRPAVWHNKNVCTWYAQNTFLFLEEKALSPLILDVVHPRLFRTRVLP